LSLAELAGRRCEVPRTALVNHAYGVGAKAIQITQLGAAAAKEGLAAEPALIGGDARFAESDADHTA